MDHSPTDVFRIVGPGGRKRQGTGQTLSSGANLADEPASRRSWARGTPTGPAIEIAPLGLRPVVRLRGRVVRLDDCEGIVPGEDDRPEALSPEFIRRHPD